MAQELINLGALADDGTGDTIRLAGIKINNNFTELFATSSVESHINVIQNNITTDLSNADIVLKPAGTGTVVFPGVTIDDNNIKATRTNDDIKFIASGSGSVVIDGLGFSGTSITATDSSSVNINENLNISGDVSATSLVDTGATEFGSTVSVPTGLATLSTLTVSGASSFVGTTTIDNLTFNDNIISTSSNADLNLTPGGTGVVNVSNLTIDSSINLTDNVIKVSRSNDDFVLSANGTGSVQVSKIDMDEGTVDNTVIGGTTPASGTFTTVSITDPSVTADGVTITDNTISTNASNSNLELSANGSGYVRVDNINFTNSGGLAGQVLKTNGSGQLSWFTSPILFDVSLIDDGTATITGNSSTQTIDSFSASTYRSAKYHIQISDSTADRYTIMEANVSHDGSTAYISTFGAATNGDGDGSTIYDSLDLSADINGGNVRLRGTVNNTNNQVIKFVRRPIKV